MKHTKFLVRDGTGYKRAYLHFDYYLGKALENIDSFLDMNDIRNLLKKETGFLFHPKTIEKLNFKYSKKYGMGPLCQFSDKYKLNYCLYSLKQIEPPRVYKKL